MYQYLKKTLVVFISLAVFVFFYSSANAYVLQGPHILELMISKLGRGKRLLVDQRLVLYDTDQKKEAVELSETVRYIFSQAFRSDILSENVQRIHVISKDAALTVIDGKVAADHETRFDHYKDILLLRSRILIQERLSSLGVDVSVSSLGRFQGKTAYVLGAEYPDESVPQVWIDKDTFRPFRWLIIGRYAENRKDSLEVRYLGWRNVGNTWYPMHIEFYQNNVLVREINVYNIKVNVSFPEYLFDIEHIKSIYPLDAPVQQEQNESEGLNKVQKTIEEFKKIFE